MKEEAHCILKEIKIISAHKRLLFIRKLLLGIGVLRLIKEITQFGLLNRAEFKCILVVFYTFTYFLPVILEKQKEHAILVSFALAEIINVIMIAYAFFLQTQCAMLWIQASAIASFYYQGCLIIDFKHHALFSLKQTLIWVVPSLLYTDGFLLDPLIVLFGTVGTFAFYLSGSYFDYLKDLDMCKAKFEIQTTNEKIQSIVNAVTDSFVVLDQKMSKKYSNLAFDHQIQDEEITMFLKENRYHRRYYSGNSTTNQLYNDIEDSFQNQIGTEIGFGVTRCGSEYFEWNGKLIVWESTPSIILFGKNVTHILDLEKESSENKYKSALLKTVSHELRTPTNAISGMAQMIKSSGEMSAENEERLEIIMGSCSYQLCLINDLLDYAQILAGCLKTIKEPFNPAKLVIECLKLIKIQTQGRSVLLEEKLVDLPEMLVSDQHRLKQVILNLLSNAKKFTLQGKIILKARYYDKKLEIKCKDTGVGIPPGKLSVLFTQFGKIDNSASINPHGVGLGLMISNMLIKELGGDRIYVKSIEGKGSCFSFILNVDEDKSLEIPKENSNVMVPSIHVKTLLTKAQVLIVDDTYFNILFLSHILKAEGILFSYVLSGKDAIEKIKKIEFACVLMDCEMPLMDGWETSKLIRAMSEKKEISKMPSIIACTAHSSDEIRIKCLESGMDDVLIKPSSQELSVSKIKNWIHIYLRKFSNDPPANGS